MNKYKRFFLKVFCIQKQFQLFAELSFGISQSLVDTGVGFSSHDVRLVIV